MASLPDKDTQWRETFLMRNPKSVSLHRSPNWESQHGDLLGNYKQTPKADSKTRGSVRLQLARLISLVWMIS